MRILSPKARQLKIYSKYQQPSQWKSKLVPEIRLCGKWLEDMGFDYGEHVTLRLEGERLIIEPVGELRKNPQLEIW